MASELFLTVLGTHQNLTPKATQCEALWSALSVSTPALCARSESKDTNWSANFRKSYHCISKKALFENHHTHDLISKSAYIFSNHYIAFAKTPKRIRIAVLSLRFKLRLKCQVQKNQEFPISCPSSATTLFCLNFKLSGIEPGSTAELPTTLTNKPKHWGERKLSFHVYETIPFCQMVNFHFPMVEIPFPDISSPKIQSVD